MTEMKQCGLKEIKGILAKLDTEYAPSSALIGFDGYVDALYRVVKTRGVDGKPAFFRTIAEYGERITRASGESADIDIRLQSRQFGGNAPLMADGLAALGDEVCLIGALGVPTIDPVFQNIHGGIQIMSYADPCQTIALEFEDGKIMMGDLKNSNYVTWDQIQSALGSEAVDHAMRRANVIALLNLSAHAGMAEITHRLAGKTRKDQTLFFDISDPASLPPEAFGGMLREISGISGVRRVILGLNENEAQRVFRTMFPDIDASKADARGTAERYGAMLREALGLDCLTIHANTYAMGFGEAGSWMISGFHEDQTCFSTGAGDHYNAAFCHGTMHGWPLEECLTFASAASAYFVKYGRSPKRTDLVKYLVDFHVKMD